MTRRILALLLSIAAAATVALFAAPTPAAANPFDTPFCDIPLIGEFACGPQTGPDSALAQGQPPQDVADAPNAAAGDAAGAATGAVVGGAFASLAAEMGAGAGNLMGYVAQYASASSAPDLTQAWWIDAYEKSFAVAVILMGLLLLWQVFQGARGNASPEDVLTSIGMAPLFLAGCVFGPALAVFLIQGAALLTEGLASSMSGLSTAQSTGALSGAVDAASTGQIIGGVVMACILFLFVFIAAIAVFAVLLIQSVMVYLAAAVFPLGWAWIVSIRNRGGSMKLPILVLVSIWSKPLLIFILGVCMALAQAATGQGASEAQNFGLLLVAVVALATVAFAPFAILKALVHVPDTADSGGHSSAHTAGQDMSRSAGSGLQRLAARGGRAASSAAQASRGMAAAGRAAQPAESPTSGKASAAAPARSAASQAGPAAGGPPAASTRRTSGGTPSASGEANVAAAGSTRRRSPQPQPKPPAAGSGHSPAAPGSVGVAAGSNTPATPRPSTPAAPRGASGAAAHPAGKGTRTGAASKVVARLTRRTKAAPDRATRRAP